LQNRKNTAIVGEKARDKEQLWEDMEKKDRILRKKYLSVAVFL
jgi:hypothetical protein